MTARPRPRHWFSVHLAALTVASLAAAVTLMGTAPPFALIAWPFIFAYGATVGMAAYGVAIRLEHTGWLASAATGAIVGGWFAVWAIGGPEFWPVIRGFGGAGIVSALTFRAIVVAVIGPAWWSRPDASITPAPCAPPR